ncbi:acyltransferase [Xanthobacter autotrophicus]|uniref:acyltransferase family protein n=1 Tax=Xanthobacter TaxID=279 RepID=UPI0024ABFFA3|nr:acyltransferase [Xanthobacter autotrophicus]MDI4663852.1 acyltransferase [Xanthobacter autotrophicus]
MESARYRALDGLRGMAALLVVFYHMTVSSIFKSLPIVIHGDLAVDVFFILSGFVISSAYAGRIDDSRAMQRFLILRFFRVYPLHFCVLMVFLAQELFKLYLWNKGITLNKGAPFTGDQSPGLFFATLFLVQAWGMFDRNFWNGPSWSISCEVFAYLVFALTAPLRPLRWRFAPLGVLIFAACSYIYAATLHDGLEQAFYGPAAILRGLSGFFLGALCYEAVTSGRLKQLFAAASDGALNLWQGGTVLAVLLLLSVCQGPTIIVALVPLTVLVLLLHTDRGLACALLNTRPLQALGRISYSIYMVHFFILVTTDTILKRVIGERPDGAPWSQMPLWQGTLLSLALALVVVAVAGLTWRFIEEPGRAFGRRLVGGGGMSQGTGMTAGKVAPALDTSGNTAMEAAPRSRE